MSVASSRLNAMTAELAGVRVEFGPNLLMFPDADTAVAFMREQGCQTVSYWPIWHTRAIV